jgi:23S rRNA (guanosine2251-2'-O)-methyltransferase
MSAGDLIYGRWPVKEALQAGSVGKVFIAKGVGGDPINEIVKLAQSKKIPLQWVDRRRLDQMAGAQHQGVAAQIGALMMMDLADLLAEAKATPSKGPSILFLDGIQDPQNLGSLIRSAVYFGVIGVVIPKWRAAPVTGTVMKASAGAASHIGIVEVANLSTAMETARKQGFWIVGADMSGTPVKKADIPRPFALAMGSEGPGLHELVRKKCDLLINIPKTRNDDVVASLNVGVAAGILLHQFT